MGCSGSRGKMTGPIISTRMPNNIAIMTHIRGPCDERIATQAIPIASIAHGNAAITINKLNDPSLVWTRCETTIVPIAPTASKTKLSAPNVSEIKAIQPLRICRRFPEGPNVQYSKMFITAHQAKPPTIPSGNATDSPLRGRRGSGGLLKLLR